MIGLLWYKGGAPSSEGRLSGSYPRQPFPAGVKSQHQYLGMLGSTSSAHAKIPPRRLRNFRNPT